MTKEEIIEMACQAFGGVIKKEERDNFINFAKLVAKHTLMNVDPSKFMSFQEGIDVGRIAEREACAKICSEFPDVGYVKAILTCDYHSYLINKRGTKMSAIPISQMANDILKIIEEVALDYPEKEREELKAVMLGQLGLAMFNRPMGDKNE